MRIESSAMNMQVASPLQGNNDLAPVNVGGGGGSGQMAGWKKVEADYGRTGGFVENKAGGMQNISDILGLKSGSTSSVGGGGNMMADDILKSLKSNQTQAKRADTVSSTHPFQLTSDERINNRPAYEGHTGLDTPQTIGNTISGILESVHDKTSAYEEKSNGLANQRASSPVDEYRESMTSSYSSLSGKKAEEKSDLSIMNESIDKYMQVMNDSYEYSIFTSMTVDVGKDVSQTANNLTKG